MASSSPSPQHLPSPTAPIRPPAPTGPRGRNQLALASFLLSLIFPVGVALNVVTILVLRVTTASAVAGATQVISGVIGIAGFAGFSAAIVTGHLALSRAKRYPPWQARRGLAIAGLVMGYLSLLLLIAYVALFITLLVQTPP
jgi:hypothetical protein